jgi:hypothetical protein
MRKSVTLISMALTTFVMVLLTGVVYAYQGFIAPSPTPTAQASSSVQTVALPLVEQAPGPAGAPVVSPQDAASIAVKFSTRTDLYSVELADFNGSQSYKVTFSSGDVIYVSMTGQVVGSAPLSQSILAYPTPPSTPVVLYTGPIKKRASGGGGDSGNSVGGGGGGGDHEGGDD